jgi:hypothetical protein
MERTDGEIFWEMGEGPNLRTREICTRTRAARLCAAAQKGKKSDGGDDEDDGEQDSLSTTTTTTKKHSISI